MALGTTQHRTNRIHHPVGSQLSIYHAKLQEIEDEIYDAISIQPNEQLFSLIQARLDEAAAIYQDDNEIGKDRYRLYELQALIHYYTRNDERALSFIDDAINLRGEMYSRAKEVRTLILAGYNKNTDMQYEKMSKAEKRKRLIGLEGWLAWFVVGLILSSLITTYNLFTNGISQSDIDTLNELKWGLGNSFYGAIIFEDIALFIYVGLSIATLVLLFKRRRLAKSFAIMMLIFGAVYGIIDYALTSKLFDSTSLLQTVELKTYMNKYAGEVGRGTAQAFLWVPYFLISKRVKNTLIK